MKHRLKLLEQKKDVAPLCLLLSEVDEEELEEVEEALIFKIKI